MGVSGGRINRRKFLKVGAAMAAAGGGALYSSLPTHAASSSSRRRVLILGIDGMSPDLLSRLMAEGRMPNFQKLAKEGDFKKLTSSNPPQSPVAWSNFITGMNPGMHGIFDFIHRDPTTVMPYLSTSRTFPATVTLPVGGWRLPLRGGGAELLRRGPAFWKILSDRGVPCSVYRVPVNFPPVECAAESLSGLGTPDMVGAYGIASYITDVAPPNRDKLTSTHLSVVDMSKHRCEAFLIGPENSFLQNPTPMQVKVTIHRDPVNPVARITVQDAQILLKQGEWSDWVRVRFDMMRHVANVTGICRFFLKEVHPHFRLYVSPLNIDPARPALPISSPPEFSAKLVRRLGLFHTQGIAEDTKSLSAGLLTDGEYLDQAMEVYGEQRRAYDYFLENFERGLLFFYISSIDLNSHMFWRAMDPRHPLYTPELAGQYGKTIEDLYRRMDILLGKALEHVDDDTVLIILSDHGFNPFYRTFNLNSWLLENGYAKLLDPARGGGEELFVNTDWSKTSAYGLGINSLYLNLRGREKQGCVSRGRDEEALVRELAAKLEAEKDPQTGERVIVRAYPKNEIYRGECIGLAPDIVVGYSWGYRASWGTILGAYEKKVVANNEDRWSGDHCMDVNGLPGVLLSNKKITSDTPSLRDLAPTILAAYGVEAPPNTEGKPVLELK